MPKPSFDRYRFEYTEAFDKDLKKYAGIRRRVARKVDNILENPFRGTELLTRKRVDLRGKRSARVTRNFRIIFAVCEECISRGFKRKEYNDCTSCTKEEIDDIIVFFKLAPHEKAYGKP